MADIVALGQYDDTQSYTFYNLSTDVKYWFVVPHVDANRYDAALVCWLERLPVVPCDEGGEELLIPTLFDENALLLLNYLRGRCGLAAVAVEGLEDEA